LPKIRHAFASLSLIRSSLVIRPHDPERAPLFIGAEFIEGYFKTPNVRKQLGQQFFAKTSVPKQTHGAPVLQRISGRIAADFEGFVRRVKCIPPAIMDLDGLLQGESRQADESLESKRIVAIIADKKVAENTEAATIWERPVISSLLRHVRIHKSGCPSAGTRMSAS
jgi:hypothetical protein